jgi:hypothetical protein
MEATSVLPYRTDALALGEWLSARARGRSTEQLRGAVESPKAVEGTAAAAAALGFVDLLEGGLTPAGERYALAEAVERRRLLREALLGYAPYREMLDALGERGAPAETEVRWIEAWWATRGFGSSESNRREGAAAFGRLGEFAGLGEYVPGRRGHPTRIRWTPGILQGGSAPPPAPPARTPAPATASGTATPPPRRRAPGPDPDPDLFTAPPLPDRTSAAAVPAPASDPVRALRPAPSPSATNRITVPLAGDATARIEVPLRLPRAEKRRLLDLLQLLITED